MAYRRSHSLGVVPVAIATVAALGLSSAATPGLATGRKTVPADVALLDTEAWIIGGSGVPIPPIDTYVKPLYDLFINPSPPFFHDQPTFGDIKANPLYTPEGLYPNSGVKSLELDPSLAQDVAILNNTINGQIVDGNNLVVLGYSQSSTASTMEMRDLMALPADQRPDADQLKFVLLGDPNNPNGGMFERFDVLNHYPTIPSLGITFNGATPADVGWDTSIYTLEYDGYADFPRYPLDLLSDLNAVLGIQYEHTMYPDLAPGDHGPGVLADAILLPGSTDYTGALPDGVDAATNTNYYMIPSEILPLLEPLTLIPVIGQPLYDLLEPDMRILVDLGYGNVDTYVDGVLTHGGWDTGPANVPTPYAVLPSGINLGELLNSLGQGTEHGINAFVGGIGSEVNGLPDAISGAITGLSGDLTGADGGTAVDAALPSLTDIVNTLSSAASTAYATLLPTADLINATVTALIGDAPSLIAEELSKGDLAGAIGMPVAGLFGLGSVAAGFEFLVLLLAGATIADDFESLFPG